MLTAREAAAVSHLLTPKDFSIHKHIEIRIWDSIQNGGKSIIYAGEMTETVLKAMEDLGYECSQMKHKDKIMYRIGWDR